MNETVGSECRERPSANPDAGSHKKAIADKESSRLVVAEILTEATLYRFLSGVRLRTLVSHLRSLGLRFARTRQLSYLWNQALGCEGDRK